MTIEELNDTKSHSEKDIYNGCLYLMKSLVQEFESYLEYLDVEIPDGERFCVGVSNMEIVNALFLARTDHSGGTSTRKKCRELDLEPAEVLEFGIYGEEQEK